VNSHIIQSELGPHGIEVVEIANGRVLATYRGKHILFRWNPSEAKDLDIDKFVMNGIRNIVHNIEDLIKP
jgi:hypothetical protein